MAPLLFLSFIPFPMVFLLVFFHIFSASIRQIFADAEHINGFQTITHISSTYSIHNSKFRKLIFKYFGGYLHKMCRTTLISSIPNYILVCPQYWDSYVKWSHSITDHFSYESVFGNNILHGWNSNLPVEPPVFITLFLNITVLPLLPQSAYYFLQLSSLPIWYTVFHPAGFLP